MAVSPDRLNVEANQTQVSYVDQPKWPDYISVISILACIVLNALAMAETIDVQFWGLGLLSAQGLIFIGRTVDEAQRPGFLSTLILRVFEGALVALLVAFTMTGSLPLSTMAPIFMAWTAVSCSCVSSLILSKES